MAEGNMGRKKFSVLGDRSDAAMSAFKFVKESVLEVNICLSNVYIGSNGQPQEFIRDAAQMESRNDEFMLTGLLGE
jgi:hypothetical protein